MLTGAVLINILNRDFNLQKHNSFEDDVAATGVAWFPC